MIPARDRWFLFAVLVIMGAGWGATQPLSKIAVSEGYRQFGLIFWQLVIGAIVLGAICTLRGKSLPLGPRYLGLYAMIALLGTVLPGAASFQALVYLPAGLISILLSLVPMMAFPVALALGNETFRWRRIAGLSLGLIGVLLIIAPEASLPERAMVAFIPLAMIAPMFYAMEGNIVARWGTLGLDAMQVMFGASLVGIALSAPLALGLGQWIDPRGPWGLADYAFLASALIHAAVYTCYVWLVGRAGAVFAVQVSYLVTAFGVLWSMIFLGERYSIWVWAAFAVLLVGLTLVQPRPRLLDSPDASRDTE